MCTMVCKYTIPPHTTYQSKALLPLYLTITHTHTHTHTQARSRLTTAAPSMTTPCSVPSVMVLSLLLPWQTHPSLLAAPPPSPLPVHKIRYIHTHTHTHTHKREREKERYTHTHIHTQRERWRWRYLLSRADTFSLTRMHRYAQKEVQPTSKLSPSHTHK
jgi:hypothetical protein